MTREFVRDGALFAVSLLGGALLGHWLGSSAWGVAVVLFAWSGWFAAGIGFMTLPRRYRRLWPDAGVLAALERRIGELERARLDAIGESKQLQRELVASATAMPDGVVVLNGEGVILWMNAAAARFLGLENPGDVGRRLAHLVRVPEFQAALARKPPKGELEIVSGAGPALKALSVYLAPYGKSRILVSVRDISRVKRLEQMRRDFVANASHELRSPLTVLSGYLEMMADDVETAARWHQPLESARSQAKRMQAILEDLLELSRLESEPGAAPKEVIDIALLFQRIRREIQPPQTKPPEVRVEVDGDVMLLGRTREIESAVQNLLVNALRYTPADGQVSMIWKRLPDGRAELAVLDTGVGIPEQDLPRITERFYCVDKSRSRARGGTGLGLAIVRHVAERHQAELHIESQVGVGSRFALRFPANRLRLPESANQAKMS